MADAIDRLHRLAKAIRQPGITSQVSKALNFRPKDEFGNDAIASFEEYSLEIIRQVCPGVPDYLLRRLGMANAARRRLFLFRREHMEMLHGGEQEPAQSRSSISRRNIQVSTSALPQEVTDKKPMLPEPPKTSPDPHSRPQSSIAKATSFVESQFKPNASSKAASSVGGTSVASMFSHSRLPPPPKIPTTRKHFECPYCCQLVSTAVLSRNSWR